MKRTYQLGMETRYAAYAMQQWIEDDMPCEVIVHKAKTEGLIVIEITDTELANKILLKTRCKVHIKGE
jgi:hypothetical protein